MTVFLDVSKIYKVILQSIWCSDSKSSLGLLIQKIKGAPNEIVICETHFDDLTNRSLNEFSYNLFSYDFIPMFGILK